MKLPRLVTAGLSVLAAFVFFFLVWVAVTYGLGYALAGAILAVLLFVWFALREDDRRNPVKAAGADAFAPRYVPEKDGGDQSNGVL